MDVFFLIEMKSSQRKNQQPAEMDDYDPNIVPINMKQNNKKRKSFKADPPVAADEEKV